VPAAAAVMRATVRARVRRVVAAAAVATVRVVAPRAAAAATSGLVGDAYRDAARSTSTSLTPALSLCHVSPSSGDSLERSRARARVSL
jgi:hypothetical protein